MKKWWNKYALEILVFICGTIITVISYVVFKSMEMAGISFVLTLATDTILFSFQISNRKLDENIVERVKQTFIATYLDIDQDLSKLNEKWRNDIFKEIELLRIEIKHMANGIHHIEQSKAIQYQSHLLESATEEILAIHLGESEKALKRWDPQRTTQDFSSILINANKKCRARVKKRLFIIENLIDEEYIEALHKALTIQQEMNFEIRVLQRKAIKAVGRPTPKDMLICDGAEIVIVDFVGEQINVVAYDSTTEIEQQKEIFSEFWDAARPVDNNYLKSLQQKLRTAKKRRK